MIRKQGITYFAIFICIFLSGCNKPNSTVVNTPMITANPLVIGSVNTTVTNTAIATNTNTSTTIPSMALTPPKLTAKVGDPTAVQPATNQDLEKLYNQAFESFMARRYSEAVKISGQVIAADVNHYKAYNIKGIATCYLDDLNGGMKLIDKSLSIKPDFGYAMFNKALAYERVGQYEKSLEWYDKNIAIENYVWSHYGKASIYGRRGDVDNTIKNLKIALDSDAAIVKVAEKEEDFNNVKNNEKFQALLQAYR